MTAGVGPKFDEVLRNLAGQAGSLEALLGVFFSFLHRNTDFYVTFDPATTTRAGMGFPAGKAEQLLLTAFRSFPYKPYGGAGAGEQRRRRPVAGSGSSTVPSTAAAAAAAAAPSSGSAPRGQETPPSGACSSGGVAPGAGVSSGQGSPASKPGKAPTPSAPASTPPSSPAQAPGGEEEPAVPSSRIQASPGVAAGGISVRYTKEGKQVPIGNGGVTPRYYWTQTVNEATVYVDVPPGTRSKDVHCLIQPRRLKLRVRGAGSAAAGSAAAAAAAATTTTTAGAGAAGAVAAPGGAGASPATSTKGPEGGDGGDVIFDGELPSAVSREGSMWSLNDGTTVVISFEKTTKSWWKSVVDGEPEIDTSMVGGWMCGWACEYVLPCRLCGREVVVR